MQAMLLEQHGCSLRCIDLPVPNPGDGEVLIAIEACGVCRTDLHLVDGELPHGRLPIIPGHEIVGRVIALGDNVRGIAIAQRVGVPWLGWTCGECRFCVSGRENLCEQARFTGYQINGGYAEYCVADARYCFALPDAGDGAQFAPLLCAGLIAHRALRLAGDPRRLGIYGFGAAAHIVAQVARYEAREVYAFTRPGDVISQNFARHLGVTWAGGTDQPPPAPLDAALIFAPSGELVPLALRQVDKGGCVVCGGIHMSDLPSFPYALLWGERILRSVANLTRRDGDEFLDLAQRIPVRPQITRYALADANTALEALRQGRLEGAAVLVMR